MLRLNHKMLATLEKKFADYSAHRGNSSSYGSILVSVFLLLILALFLVPLPRNLLDVLLVLNLGLALILLLRSLFLSHSLKLFSFPTILLLTTLFRLALNVSSTRLILLDGDQGLNAAGRVIEAFGSFVVQGDFVVGAIIFLVIAVVNFVVIARGSARVAEVAARFTLDALPGRQLALDAELRSGSISQEAVDQKRAALNQESQFFGAMDGAMKFVQGDAVAGLVIAFINAIGGVAIGMSRGMALDEAINTFGVLTIGDGLVSIVPSLLISVCAGIVVTSVSGDARQSASSQVITQIFAEPKVLVLAALALFTLGVIPGFPLLPFSLVAVVILFVSTRIGTLGDAPLQEISDAKLSGRVEVPGVKPLTLEVHPNSPLIDGEARAAFLDNFGKRRKNLYLERGLVLPEVEVRSGADLYPDAYRILVRDRTVRSGTLRRDALFVEANPSVLASLGFPVGHAQPHPIQCQSCSWIDQSQIDRKALGHLGIEIHTSSAFLSLQIIGASLESIDELFGLNETSAFLAPLRKEHPALVEEVLGKELLSLSELTDLLKRLILEAVSIRDEKFILEAVVEYAAQVPEADDRVIFVNELHSYVRKILSKNIVAPLVRADGELRVFGLSAEIEEEFRAANSHWEGRRMKIPFAPELEVAVREAARRLFHPVLDRGSLPIVFLCPEEIRLCVQTFFSGQLETDNWYRTLAYEELQTSIRSRSVGVLSIS